MSVQNEVVEQILNIHDSEFVKYDLLFRQCAYYYNFGKWYWPKYFYAYMDAFGAWTFQIGDIYLKDKRLVEKFDRMWGSHMTKLNKQEQIEEEKRLQKILAALKRKNS